MEMDVSIRDLIPTGQQGVYKVYMHYYVVTFSLALTCILVCNDLNQLPELEQRAPSESCETVKAMQSNLFSTSRIRSSLQAFETIWNNHLVIIRCIYLHVQLPGAVVFFISLSPICLSV